MAKLTKQEIVERRALTDYIQELGGNEVPWSMVTAQLKRLLIDYPEMSFSTVHYTLWYMVEIKGIRYNNNIVGLIPYYYDRAKEYYNEIKKIKTSIEQFNWKNMENNKTIVRNIKDDLIL